MRANLTVLNGPFAGQTIAVSHGKLLIGREVDCHLRLDSPSASRHHCALLLDEYTLRVRDLGSRNGTFVNNHRVGTSELILLDGDVVSVADVTCQVSLASETEQAAKSATEGRPVVSPESLETTGVFEGDTLPSDRPNVAPSPVQPPIPRAAG